MSARKRWRAVFPVAPGVLESATAWLDGGICADKPPDRLTFALGLCVEELLMNTLMHGASTEEALVATIEVELFPDRIELVYQDNAQPFDITQLPEAHPDRSLAEIAPGGLGVKLMRRFTDRLEYEKVPTGNRVTCVFMCAGAGKT